jgi:hypothetical protein
MIENKINNLEESANPGLKNQITARNISNFINKLNIKGFQTITLDNQNQTTQRNRTI